MASDVDGKKFETFTFLELKQAYQILAEHELENNVTFVCLKCTRNFGTKDTSKSVKLFWKDPENSSRYSSIRGFTGIPFLPLGNRVLQCRFGKGRGLTREKVKQKIKLRELDPNSPDVKAFCDKPSQARFHGGNKFCPVKVHIRELVLFPEYKRAKIPRYNEHDKIWEEISGKLKSGEELEMIHEFILQLPHVSQHCNHPEDNGEQRLVPQAQEEMETNTEVVEIENNTEVVETEKDIEVVETENGPVDDTTGGVETTAEPETFSEIRDEENVRDTHLLTLRVTPDQETAIVELFEDRGWDFVPLETQEVQLYREPVTALYPGHQYKEETQETASSPVHPPGTMFTPEKQCRTRRKPGKTGHKPSTPIDHDAYTRPEVLAEKREVISSVAGQAVSGNVILNLQVQSDNAELLLTEGNSSLIEQQHINLARSLQEAHDSKKRPTSNKTETTSIGTSQATTEHNVSPELSVETDRNEHHDSLALDDNADIAGMSYTDDWSEDDRHEELVRAAQEASGFDTNAVNNDSEMKNVAELRVKNGQDLSTTNANRGQKNITLTKRVVQKKRKPQRSRPSYSTRFSEYVNGADVSMELEVETTIEDSNSAATNKPIRKGVKKSKVKKSSDTFGHFRCTECKQSFQVLRVFNNHKRGGKCIFECGDCDKVFTVRRYSSYLLHLKYHSKERFFKCRICETSYVSLAILREHLRSHKLEGPNICDQCGMYFTTSEELLKHKHTAHNARKQIFECEVQECGRKFLDKHRLASHKLCCHNDARPYECNICGKRFQTKNKLLRTHVRVHRDVYSFNCQVPRCRAVFMTDSDLSNHIKRHNNLPSRLCDICGKGFYSKKELKLHARSHSSDKAHACPYCEFRCSHTGNLKKHVGTHLKVM